MAAKTAASYLRVEAETEGNVVGDTRQETSEEGHTTRYLIRQAVCSLETE